MTNESTITARSPANATASTLARRGFLRGLVLAPAVAATAAAGAAPAAAASPLLRENRRLTWLGEQLEAAGTAFASAVERKAIAREAALAIWPQAPAEITFPPGNTRPPVWCGVRPERGIDDETFYFFGNKNSNRKIADAEQLETYVSLSRPDGVTDRKNAKEARKLLAIAREYEARRDAAIISSGYDRAKGELYALCRRIDRVTILIFKLESRTAEGLRIKARALIAAAKTDVVDDFIAHRSKVLYAEALALAVIRVADAG